MPLQSLVDYFNDSIELELRSSIQPFILENEAVSGLFGPIRIMMAGGRSIKNSFRM